MSEIRKCINGFPYAIQKSRYKHSLNGREQTFKDDNAIEAQEKRYIKRQYKSLQYFKIIFQLSSTHFGILLTSKVYQYYKPTYYHLNYIHLTYDCN